MFFVLQTFRGISAFLPDLRRMEANTRSPIFTGFSELLEGIVTVRAFGVEKRFLNEMYGKIDITTRMGYNFWQANRWCLLNFDYLGSSFVLITSLLAVSTFVPAGLAGICITSAMTFSRVSYFACRFYTDLQVDLNAVERVVNYLEIPQEPPALIESNRPPAYWPSSTSNNDLLVVEDLEVKYAPNLPSVLHRVSFSLKARERVGLLGRTGSGKSTLATSLLRFVEPTGGRIIVDGIDISTIGLNDLRTRLTFIPQDATLFSGTVRDNLDPFGEFEDAECEAALHRVHLLHRSAQQSERTSARESPVPEPEGETATISGVSSVTEVDSKPVISLDAMVSAEGSNYSSGQRQLMALARALPPELDNHSRRSHVLNRL
ncbi:P-loop containing nucleoside triphosphate hydrolase protein [Mycena leptocephala]|nr:P-loop containing nucleoside triphosphate hydrolase protein [Mycena leptocephala]